MDFKKFSLATVALAALASCAVYPPERDTTQPDKVRKSALYCGDPTKPWKDCRNEPAAAWYFRPTVVDAPYEAWWTFVGEQGDMLKINWEVGEDLLIAYRTTETFKGSEGDAAKAPGFKGEPIAAWRITSHFDVQHQYNSSTGEELPVLYESTERPWYEREFIRVDWSKSLISGYGFFMGSKLTVELFGEVKSEPVSYAVTDPRDPDYRVLTNDYIDIVSRETHTPMTNDGMDGYFQESPISQVSYRYSFMRANPTPDYAPFYYPDPVFEKFGFFRTERETYQRDRGVTDFKDLLMNRWNIWAKTHTTQACSTSVECTGGTAAQGVSCDLMNKNAEGKGLCTLPYTQRGVKQIVYYLSPNFPDRYLADACATVQGWNIEMKTTVAALLNQAYTPPIVDEDFAAACKLSDFKDLPADATQVDVSKHDMFVLRQNRKDCDSDGNVQKGDRWCYRAGDLRYSMLYWVDQPSSGSPLGYGPVASDPATGQIIQGNAFIYGAAVDSYQSYISDVYDLVQGNVTEDQLRSGENVRETYQNASGNVFPPSFPQNGFRVNDLDQLNQFKDRLKNAKELAERLKHEGRTAQQPYAAKIRGSIFEKMVVENDEWKLAHGFDSDHALTDAEVDQISPFSDKYQQRMQGYRNIENVLSESKHCVYRTNEYTDATVTWLAKRYADQGLSRTEAIRKLMQSVFRGVTEHELGHNMGLRHNFEGSFDADNYFNDYYDLKGSAALKDPEPTAFGTLPLTPDQYEKYDAAKRAKRLERDAAGIKMFQYSTIMDYGGQFYSDFRALGKYDAAAIKFGYGNLVEVFDGAPNATRSNRKNQTWYLGGDECKADTDCAYAGVGQACVAGPTGSTKKFCSSWDKDSAARAATNPPAKFRFCSDERVADRPFCNRFDEGASSSEIVENLIESYDRNYVFNNFRRYRRYFGPAYGGRIWDRYYSMMGKQYASLLYQLYYNPTSTLSTGAGSFSDMLSASVKAMNFFERVLTTPDVGTYTKRPLEVAAGGAQRNIYERTSSDCTEDGDFHACLGVGKHFYSVWETGYYGAIERQARAGVFTDKIYAMLALTNKSWGNPQANDETYPISFYDGFQGEMLSLFTGMISNDITRFAPAIKFTAASDPNPNKPYVAYRDVWSGSFFGTDATAYDYNANPIVKYPGSADLDHRYDTGDLLDPQGSSTILRYYALAFSLTGWPSVYDTTYSDYLQLYTFGGPEVRFPSDGLASVSYESPRRKKTYVAVQTPDNKSIIFPLVKKAAETKAEYDHYNGLTPVQLAAEWSQMQAKFPRACNVVASNTAEKCRAAVVNQIGNDLDDRESFLNLTYDLRSQLGMSY